MGDEFCTPCVIPTYLGWNNAERDKSSLRLYATDHDSSPRWAKDDQGGRVAEYACTDNGGVEGDRYLLVRVGNRFVSDEQVQTITEQIEALLAETGGDSAEN